MGDAMRGWMLVAVAVGLSAYCAGGQEPGVAGGVVVSNAPNVLIAPEVLPLHLATEPAGACAQTQKDEVSLTLVVDAHGMAQKIAAVDAKGTPRELKAVRIVEQQSFKPATLHGEPVESRWWMNVDLEGCVTERADAAGNRVNVYRMTAQPVEAFEKCLSMGMPPATAACATQTAEEKSLAQVVAAANATQPEYPNLMRVGNGVSAPVPRNSVEAEFSYEARRQRVQGTVLIRMIVDAQGMPQNPQVMRGIGYGLDEKAIKAVKKYRFKPAMKEGGVPVPVMIMVEVNFRLYEKN